MVMGYVWTALVSAALLFGLWTGQGSAVGTAALTAAGEAVELGLRLAGPLMLWSGIMELMSRSGLSRKLAAALSPVLCRLFPSCREDGALLSALSFNVSANLLGLGNAATPAGIEAARRLQRQGCREEAGNELCRLVVLNTASLQLLPTTVAALRSSLGAAAPFDILPAVWLSSIAGAAVGLGTARLLEKWS